MAGRRNGNGPPPQRSEKVADALSRFKDALEREQPELKQEALPLEIEQIQADAVTDAVIRNGGRPGGILKDLGMNNKSLNGSDRHAIMVKIARIPGVMERVRKHYGDLERMREKVLARQVFIALYGRDDLATAAAGFLAKVGGWIAPTRIDQNINRKSWNIHQFLAETEVQEALKKLKHEPGEAVLVHSEAHALESGKDE